jgi:hypothetical protein
MCVVPDSKGSGALWRETGVLPQIAVHDAVILTKRSCWFPSRHKTYILRWAAWDYERSVICGLLGKMGLPGLLPDCWAGLRMLEIKWKTTSINYDTCSWETSIS